ncbi:MAG: ParB/RepB/Spo0J family partition protein [bacterium]
MKNSKNNKLNNKFITQVSYLDINSIYPNPYQPRNYFDESALLELALSIKKYGLLEPIIVRYVRGGIFEVISGERRLKACKKIGLEFIACIIIKTSDRECACIALTENMQSEGLNFIEEAESLQTLMVYFGYSKDDLARITGKSYSSIEKELEILKLSSNIKNMLLANNININYALLLLKLESDELKQQVINKVIEFDLNLKETSDLITNTIRESNCIQQFKPNQKIKGYITDIRIFTNTLKSAINMMQQSGISASYLMQQINQEKYQKEHQEEYEIKINIIINK